MTRRRGRAAIVVLLACAALPAGAAPPAGLTDAPPGAAACSGCHSPGNEPGSAVPRIHGRPPAELLAALAAFRSGERPATVMNRIAPGFTTAEMAAIVDWLGRQGTP